MWGAEYLWVRKVLIPAAWLSLAALIVSFLERRERHEEWNIMSHHKNHKTDNGGKYLPKKTLVFQLWKIKIVKYYILHKSNSHTFHLQLSNIFKNVYAQFIYQWRLTTFWLMIMFIAFKTIQEECSRPYVSTALPNYIFKELFQASVQVWKQ